MTEARKGCSTIVYQRRNGFWVCDQMYYVPTFEEWWQIGREIYRSEVLAFEFAEQVAFTLEHDSLPTISFFDHFDRQGNSFLWECRGFH